MATICTGGILVYTGNVDISQNQKFPPRLLSYSSHLRENKRKRSSLKITKFAKHKCSHGTEHCIATKRNSTWSKCPLTQTGECSLGIFLSAQKINLLSHSMRWVWCLSEGCTPAQCSALPACQQVIHCAPRGHAALAHPTPGIVWNFPSPTCSSTKPQLCGGDHIKINLA